MSSNPNRNTPVAADSIGPNDTTVVMALVDLPLWVRVNHELANTTDLEPTVELPMLLRRQAE
jgi:hypothetical protein